MEYLLYLVPLLIFIAMIEQLLYLKKKRFLPGPTLIIPFIGNVAELLHNPTKFWEEQSAAATWSKEGASAFYFLGRFAIFIRDTELSHKVFNNVRKDAFHLVGHPFGKKLFGDHNMIYKMGQEHKNLRRRIAPNFTPKALSAYIAIQQRIILKHLIHWEQLSAAAPTPIPLRLLCRELNLETSQTVFVRPYMSERTRSEFNSNYNLFNQGLIKLPIDLPGFAFRKARLAVDRLVETLARCAEESKARMERGYTPECLCDFWMREEDEDGEIGGHLFDFLFAAQDASTSSLLWAVTLLDSHPDVLAKVRHEVSSLWDTDSDSLITPHQLSQMKYTQAVSREILRFRSPATLVPHVAGEDFPLTDSYTIPKGTIVFPSVFDSSLQGFTDPDRFDPDRFGPDRREDVVYKRNFLTFGTGAHQCVGQRYASNHLVLFIAMFSSLLDFNRYRTDGCDDLAYVPTISPKDDCRVFLSRRCARYPTYMV